MMHFAGHDDFHLIGRGSRAEKQIGVDCTPHITTR
jgi:hypothetical protein